MFKKNILVILVVSVILFSVIISLSVFGHKKPRISQVGLHSENGSLYFEGVIEFQRGDVGGPKGSYFTGLAGFKVLATRELSAEFVVKNELHTEIEWDINWDMIAYGYAKMVLLVGIVKFCLIYRGKNKLGDGPDI